MGGQTLARVSCRGRACPHNKIRLPRDSVPVPLWPSYQISPTPKPDTNLNRVHPFPWTHSPNPVLSINQARTRASPRTSWHPTATAQTAITWHARTQPSRRPLLRHLGSKRALRMTHKYTTRWLLSAPTKRKRTAFCFRLCRMLLRV